MLLYCWTALHAVRERAKNKRCLKCAPVHGGDGAGGGAIEMTQHDEGGGDVERVPCERASMDTLNPAVGYITGVPV